MTTRQAGSGGLGRGTEEASTPAPASHPRRQSAAKVRKTIVRVLGGGKEMTPDEIQHAAAMVLGSTEHPTIEAQLRVLRDGDYITPAEGDARRVSLTSSGKRWSDGIQALSGQGRNSETRA